MLAIEHPHLYGLLEGRTYRRPVADISISDDLLNAWCWHARDNFPSTCGYDVRRFAWDIRRRAIDDESGREYLRDLCESWRGDFDLDAIWNAADRPQCDDDALVMDELCALHRRGTLFDLDDDGALRGELQALADRFDRTHADDVEVAAGHETMQADIGIVGRQCREHVAELRKQPQFCIPLSDYQRQWQQKHIEAEQFCRDYDNLNDWHLARLKDVDECDNDKAEQLAAEYLAKSKVLEMKHQLPALLQTSIAAPVAKASSIPLTDAQKIVASLGQPVLDEFMKNTPDTPRPVNAREYPKLPDNCASHPLYDLLNNAIVRVVSMAEEAPKHFRQDRVLRCLAVLHAVHPIVSEQVFDRITASDAVLSPAKFDSAVKGFENKVRREINTGAGFLLDSKGNPAADNSDNVAVFLNIAGKKLRRNAWFDRNEIADLDKDNWLHLDDDARQDLLVDAENSQFNYHPSEGRFYRALNKIARENIYDPVLDRIDQCARKWDGVPRLDTWLHHTCNVPADAYHAAVGRNIIGGMVRRARHPGCKHDEVAILISPEQGKGKSTVAEILALEPDWFTDTIEIGGRKVDVIPEMRGKWIIELQELAGMSKTEVERVKAFVSTKKDNVTLKYKAEATEPPRRCIFIGTSNDKRPLRDATGGRRFLPVHLGGEADLAWLRANVEQIIGEAAVREANGESFSIPREIWQTAGEHQEAARQTSALEDHIRDLLEAFAKIECKVASADILEALRHRRCNDNKIGAAMERLGFRQRNQRERTWLSSTATDHAPQLSLRRTLHEVTFKIGWLSPPPY